MYTFHKFFGVGVVVALLGLNVVLADVKTDSARKPLTFSLDIGDASVILPDISFDNISANEEAQTTCAMTPGGSSSILLNPPPITIPRPEQWRNAPQTALAPLGSYSQGRVPYQPRPRLRPEGTRIIPDDPPILVPEPATLLIVGLGIGTVAFVRRREDKAGR